MHCCSDFHVNGTLQIFYDDDDDDDEQDATVQKFKQNKKVRKQLANRGSHWKLLQHQRLYARNDSQSASSLESMQSSSPSQCHASLMHSRDVTQRNWLMAHSVGGGLTPAPVDTSADNLDRRSASAAVQLCSSELSWQSMSPSHRQTSGMHCWLPHCQWSSSHVIGSRQCNTVGCLP